MSNYPDTMAAILGKIKDGPVKDGLNAVVRFHADTEDKHASNRANGDLSATGKIKGAREDLKKHSFQIVRAKKLVEQANAALAQKKANISLPPVDPTDVLAATMHVEARGLLRSMASKAEKKAFLTNASLPVLQAVLAAPDELTGIDGDIRQAASSRAMEIAHPGKTAELTAEREAINLLASALRAASDVAREFADLPNQQALDDFVNQAVPDQRHIEADIARQFAPPTAA